LFKELEGIEKNRGIMGGFFVKSQYKAILLVDFENVKLWYTKVASMIQQN